MEDSLLNNLPTELRLEIYEYVFTFESLTCKGGYWRVARKGERNRRPLSKELGATLACKQMRNETVHLPFSLNNVVCGNKVGDFDPYYEWWIAPPLKDPCSWAFDALSKMTPSLLSDSTRFYLHLWVYPGMSEPRRMSNTAWIELSNALRALMGVLGPVKLIITLHFHYHYETLRCEYPDSGPLIPHNEAVIDICLGDPTVARGGLVALAKAVDDRRQALQQHEDHQTEGCRVNYHKNKLSMQLMQAEQVSRRFIDVATWASIPGAQQPLLCTLLGMGEATDSPTRSQDPRRDSTRPSVEK